MQELQDRYDELEDIEDTLRCLIDKISDKDYIEQLQEIMYQVQNEKEEIAPQLQEMYEAEEREMNYSYERSVI